MSWRSITTGKRILLSEEPRMNADDFQLTQEDLGETGQDNQDFQTTEIPGDDPAQILPPIKSPGQQAHGHQREPAAGGGRAHGGSHGTVSRLVRRGCDFPDLGL